MSHTPSEPIDLGSITVTFTVDAKASGGSVTVSRCDVKAGAGMPVAHSHDAFEETLYGLEGVTTLTLDGRDIDLGPGDTVCIRRGAVHSFMANDEDVAFLAIATPGVFGPDYFHEIAEILQTAGDGPPDPAAIGAVMLRHGLLEYQPGNAADPLTPSSRAAPGTPTHTADPPRPITDANPPAP